MKKLFLSVIIGLVIGITSLHAGDDLVRVDVTKLTPAQLKVYQELVQIQNGKVPAIDLENLTADKIDKYAQIGKAFGSAFKECWTTVSADSEKFGQSPAGKWTMILISWKIMGQDAVGLTRTLVQWMVGGLLLVVGIPFFIYAFRRNCILPPLASVKRKGLFQYVKTYREDAYPIHSSEAILYGLVFVIYMGITVAITFVH